MSRTLISLRDAGRQIVVCSNADCTRPRFEAGDLLFLCPGEICPGRNQPPPGRPEEWAGRTLFRPRRYSYSVPCPFSPHTAYVKVCPHCWAQLPMATGRSSTIAIVGSSVSGKTCFVTGLIRQIEKELARRDSYRMALEWDDQAGLDYFKERSREIFVQGILPDATQKRSKVETLQITVRFPVRGRHRFRRGSQGVVSLVFPDPAGEFFENMDNAYYLNYLARAGAIVLMVDPWMSAEYRARRETWGDPVPGVDAPDAGVALNAFIQSIRRATNRAGKLDKHLAVVLTKCDEAGLFDPDCSAAGFPLQKPAPAPQIGDWLADPEDQMHRLLVGGGRYDPRLTREISRQVERHLEDDLGLAHLVALAHQGFRDVRFFAASALGRPPERTLKDGVMRVTLDDPRPRRVEDPLLWILHEWGYW